jgi:hypothetical protein
MNGHRRGWIAQSRSEARTGIIGARPRWTTVVRVSGQ